MCFSLQKHYKTFQRTHTHTRSILQWLLCYISCSVLDQHPRFHCCYLVCTKGLSILPDNQEWFHVYAYICVYIHISILPDNELYIFTKTNTSVVPRAGSLFWIWDPVLGGPRSWKVGTFLLLLKQRLLSAWHLWAGLPLESWGEPEVPFLFSVGTFGSDTVKIAWRWDSHSRHQAKWINNPR